MKYVCQEKTFVYVNSRSAAMVTAWFAVRSIKASWPNYCLFFHSCLHLGEKKNLQPKFHDLPAWFPKSENII
jgi:hypothetical protein